MSPETEVEEEEKETAEEEETKEVSEEEAVKEVDEETEEDEEKEDTVPHGALHEERERRKDAELRHQLLEEEIEAERREAAQTASRRDKIDWEATGISNEAASTMLGEVADMNLEGRMAISHALAEEMFSDYSEVMDKSGIKQKVEADPSLQRVIARQPLPYFAAYRMAKRMLDGSGDEDVDKKVEKAKREGRREVIDTITKPRPKGLSGTKSREKAATAKTTREGAADLTAEEWANLPQAERNKLLRGDS